MRDVAQVLVLAAAELEQVFREQGAVDFPAVSMAALRALGAEDAPTDLEPAARLPAAAHPGRRVPGHLECAARARAAAHGRLAARGRTQRVLRGRSDAVDLWISPGGGQSVSGSRRGGHRRGAIRCAAAEQQFPLRPASSWIGSMTASPASCRGGRSRSRRHRLPAAASRRSSRPRGREPAVTVRGFATRGAEAAGDRRDDRGCGAGSIPSGASPSWCARRAHAREIASCLRARGIAFRAVDIEPLQDRAVVRDLVMLVCALLHLGDRTAWLALLRAPWAGLTLADLLLVARGGPTVWDALRDDAVLARLSEEGKMRCRRAALRPRGRPSRTEPRHVRALGGAHLARASAVPAARRTRASSRMRARSSSACENSSSAGCRTRRTWCSALPICMPTAGRRARSKS